MSNLYEFEFTNGRAGLGEILNDQEITSESIGYELAVFCKHNNNFMAIKFNEHSLSYANKIAAINKNCIKAMCKQ